MSSASQLGGGESSSALAGGQGRAAESTDARAVPQLHRVWGGAARVDVHTRLVTSTRAVGWVMSSLPKERPVSTAPQQVALFGRRILTEVQLERGH